jgi:beta-lactamase class A
VTSCHHNVHGSQATGARLTLFAVLRVAALAAVALAAAVPRPESEGESPGPGTSAAPGDYPALHSVPKLARDGNPGLGVYPALRDPQQLTFPSPAAVARARRWARRRRGRVSFAVADTRHGLVGMTAGRRYDSVSLIKAMILVAYLDKLARENRRPTRQEDFWLDAMIRVSDNESAGRLFHRLGADPLRQLARRAGMRSFAIRGSWSEAKLTAADQVRLFSALDRLLAPSQRKFARYILSAVEPQQSWGIPAAARPRWHTFFKGGWRPGGRGDLVHQGALLENGRRHIAIAVLTDGNPNEKYGHATVRGIAQRLLRRAVKAPPTPRVEPGQLSPLQALSGYRPPEPRPLRRLIS